MGSYVSWERVWEEVQPRLQRYWGPANENRFVKFADAQYYLPAQAEIDAVLTAVQIPRLGAAGEAFDCDDYAFLMKGSASVEARSRLRIGSGLCLGLAWARFKWLPDPFHAANWILDDRRVFYWLEPQTKKLHAADQCSGGLVLVLA